MRKKIVLLLLGLTVIASGWAAMSGSFARPEEGVLDVWVTWGDDSAQLQSLFDRYSQANGLPVRVTMGVDNDKVLKAMTSPTPPDVVILSSSELVKSYDEQGLVEPLTPWIEATGINLDDIYPAPLAQCGTLDGTYLCLPWGCDIDALFWNKDLFKVAGLDPERPPQTMEELVEYAAKLTLRNEEGKLSQVGFIPGFYRSHTDLYVRMFGGSFYNDKGTELTVNSQPVIKALNWQLQFYNTYAPEELEDFVSSFTPYMTSRHPIYAGRRMSCRQCHRSSPIQNNKIPDLGFLEGRIAMMIDSEWQVESNDPSKGLSQVNYGVAPFPPPSAHPERANTSVVQGPVVIVPAGAIDKDAAGQLLAWMATPEVLADVAHANSNLPTSRTATQDPRFQQIPNLQVFITLLDHPNARHIVTTSISLELNQALGQVEEELLHKNGGDPVLLLNEVQFEFASKLKEVTAYHGRP